MRTRSPCLPSLCAHTPRLCPRGPAPRPLLLSLPSPPFPCPSLRWSYSPPRLLALYPEGLGKQTGQEARGGGARVGDAGSLAWPEVHGSRSAMAPSGSATANSPGVQTDA